MRYFLASEREPPALSGRTLTWGCRFSSGESVTTSCVVAVWISDGEGSWALVLFGLLCLAGSMFLGLFSFSRAARGNDGSLWISNSFRWVELPSGSIGSVRRLWPDELVVLPFLVKSAQGWHALARDLFWTSDFRAALLGHSPRADVSVRSARGMERLAKSPTVSQEDWPVGS